LVLLGTTRRSKLGCVPVGWEWDETLFKGSAPYYRRGRLPYPSGLHDIFAAHADLRGRPRLIDVGCGPGIVALALADLFAEVVGVDPDPGMIAEASHHAALGEVTNATWVQQRAEELPAGLGVFRYGVFAQSFHWMDRPRVARLVFGMLEPGGAFVHLDTDVADAPSSEAALAHPEPPEDQIDALRQRYLGPVRRAGQGHLRFGTPSGESGVLQEAGFESAVVVRVPGRGVVERTVDDVVAGVFASSGTAPHLFGDRLPDFDDDLRALLATASPTGRFSQRMRDVELLFYRRPR
jgi:SAM-dependent methyltransferase